MDVNKKEVAQEVPVQEQPQYNVAINISNLNEFNDLLTEVIDKLNQLKNFKFKVETEKIV
jgi:ACT domain-containing protein